VLKMTRPAQRGPQLCDVQAVIVRGADVAAVSPMAIGSQHNTIISISHRIARSLSASAPKKLGDVADGRILSLDLPALGA
jgi:hypothetical protein